MIHKDQAFAEVIESSLHQFKAQSWEWNCYPDFGSIVKVTHDNQIVYGVVSGIETGSGDPLRYPFPYQKTEEELMAEQPQIFEFLKTIFQVNIIGYKKATPIMEKIYYVVPPKPCKIHAFVGKATTEDLKIIFASPHYMYLLFSFAAEIPNLDELLLALLRNLATVELLSTNHLEKFCETFTLLGGNDYRRLKLFLGRVESLL